VGDGHVTWDLVSSKASRLLSGRFGDAKARALLAAITRLSASGAQVGELTNALRDAADGMACPDVP
jgi:hypothetical protein